MMALRPSVGFFLAVALAMASCGEIPEPEGFSVASSTTPVAGAGDVSVASGPATTAPNLAVPRRDADYVPEVLISTSQRLLLANPELTAPLDLGAALAGLGSIHAVDDLLGGLVVQQAGGSGDIVWLSAEGDEPEIVDDQGAELLDVGYAGGSPHAVVLVGDRQVDSIRLVDPERTEVVALDDGEEVIDLSASTGIYALAIEDQQCGDLRFFSSDGEELEVDGITQPPCPVPRRPAYGAVALSPDGGVVIYTVVSYRDDAIEVATELVAVDLTTGEYFRYKIGEDGDRITALSFDGRRAVYLRQSVGQTSVTVLPLVSEGQESPIDLLGATTVNSVAFTRWSVVSGL
jgi:hypothetical protein